MSMEAFKDWYMTRYWEFDNLFLEGAKLFGITYHEFVLITLVIIWPAITFGLFIAVIGMWKDRRRSQKRRSRHVISGPI